MPLRSALIAATILATFLPASQAAAAPDRPATPQLIEQALTEGHIDEREATVLRARALAGDVPDAYRSSTPWEGTPVALQVEDATRELSRSQRARVSALESPASTEYCGSSSFGALAGRLETTHFVVEYGTLGGGLTAADYGDAL